MKYLFLLLLLFLYGCYDCGCEGGFTPSRPQYSATYMSYEELRSAVEMENPREIKERGKIYLYNSLLLINEPNKGVHFIDNSDPSAPSQKGFLNVPGNIDMAIKDGILYLDSFIDLVAVDLTNPKYPVVKRINEIFEYDPYQAIDEQWISYDKTQGVVVGYE